MNHASPLVGTWKLISLVNQSSDNSVTYPFGENAQGYIFYLSNGYMSVSIMAANRPQFSIPDLWSAPLEESAEALKTYLSYCGKYTFHEDHVIHHIEVSSLPNWIGQDEKRYVEFRENRLILSTEPKLVHDEMRHARITWQRIY